MTPKKPVNGKAEMPPPPKKPKQRALTVDLDANPTIDLLNSVTLFQRKIKFVWIRRRGEITQAGFANNDRVAEWYDATDLRTFARSQDILFKATDHLIPTPPRNIVTQVWEPVAQLIRNVSKQDAEEMESPLKDEFRDIFKSTWLKARNAIARDADAFTQILGECQTTARNPKADFPPRCAVWSGAEGELAPDYCWVHLEVLIDWLSTPNAKHKQYQWNTVRNALIMLGFKRKQLRRTITNEKGSSEICVRVWRGPIEILTEKANLFENLTD